MTEIEIPDERMAEIVGANWPADAMTEYQLTEKIVALALELGLLAHWCGKDSRHCQGRPGLLDVLIISQRGILFAEIKGPGGETSAEQDLWIWTIDQIPKCDKIPGAQWVIWNELHWREGIIRAVLEAMR
jgi:hypothetical protein